MGTDLAVCAGNMARGNMPELPYSSFVVVRRLVLNGNDIVLYTKQLQALSTDLRDWEELIEIFKKKSLERAIHSKIDVQVHCGSA